MDKQEHALTILLDEYKRASSDIASLISDSEKIFGIWVTLITLALGVGVKENIKEIFFILPAVILAVFYYLINIYERLMSTGGYAAAIEKEVNKIVGTSVLRWESYLSRDLHHFRFTTVVLIVICLGISVGIMIFSIQRNFTDYGESVGRFQMGLAGILLLLGVWRLGKLSVLHATTEKETEKLSSFIGPTIPQDSPDASDS